jgi:hypothetical protein
MSLWGRNITTTTANSTTTAESSNGQPLYNAGAVNIRGAQLGQVMGTNSHFGNTSAGSRANVDVNIYANDTPSAFINNQATGIFGVTALQMGNNINNNSKERPAHAGWVLRRAGAGPVIGGTISAPGTLFANGETVLVSNATTNAILVITTNATGNAVSVSVQSGNGGAGFTNSSVCAYAFQRQKHIANVTGTVSGNGYVNGDIITVSNATTGITNAVFVISTSANGQLANGSMLAASNTLNNVGLFGNTTAAVALAITNSAYGTANGNSVVTAVAVNIVNSSGGTVAATLGGRAGRVMTETIVAAGSLGAQSAAYGTPATTNGSGSGTTSQLYYPGP